MPNRPLPSRAAEYRVRAAETRARAQAADDEDRRALLLRDADTLERMAKWEEEVRLPPS